MDTLIVTADLRDVTISIKKRIAAYKDIEEEYNKAKEEYKSRFSNRTKGRFNNCFKEHFK